ncbi:MAG TPA: hypothetical protein QF753_09255 [Victivallales bacterium]|nr:hypothetical protein [Victivallales bacterium]
MKIIISIIILQLSIYSFSFAKEYTGVVTPLIKSRISSGSGADYNGVIIHVARIGEIFKPEILNSNNKVVQKGTPLVVLNHAYWEGSALLAKSRVNAAIAALRTAKDDYYRYKKLVVAHSESMMLLEDRRAKYFTAITNLENCKIHLMQANAILKSCFTIAPFEGIVDKVFLSSGLAVKQPQVIEISQLNPIGINVKMPREEAYKVNLNTPVTIYSLRTGKAYGVYNKNTILSDNGLTFIAENSQDLAYQGKTTDGLIIRHHKDIHNVYPFPYKNMLSVPLNSIMKDSRGSFVWAAKENKTNTPGGSMKSVFKIEKIYIISANIKARIAGFQELEALKDPGKLDKTSIILSNPPENLKDGELIYTDLERYIFMPGDRIKVIIGK